MSARILALDTTAEFGSLALVSGGEVVEEVQLHSADGFAHVLFGAIQGLLARRTWQPDEIDCFSAAAGPGSFTGVRVGLAAAKGLAEAFGKPSVAVSNLQAIAWFGSAPLRAVFFDARRGEIYGAVYDASLRLAAQEVVTTFPAWRDSLPRGDIEFLTTNLAPFREALAGARAHEVPRSLAGAVGHIAAARLAAGLALDAAALDANYVRRSDAELFWREP